MNPTTQSSNAQGQLSHDELSAALAHTTHLQEQSLPKDMPQEAPQAPQTQVDTQQQETPQQDKSAEIESKMADMEKRIMDGLKREVDGIRGEIKDAIENEPN